MTLRLFLSIDTRRTHTSLWRDLDSAARFMSRRLVTFGLAAGVTEAHAAGRAWVVLDPSGATVGWLEEVARG